MKPSYQSKTVLFNVVALLAAVFALPELSALLGPTVVAQLPIIIAVLNIALRFVTKGPISLL